VGAGTRCRPCGTEDAAVKQRIVDRDRLLEIARAMSGLPVAVIGDLVLDRYWVGRSARISREAPVLILDFEAERTVPGAAANAAMNVKALGGTPRLVGRVGRDPAGAALARALRAHRLDRRWLARDGDAETIVKTRILAGSSHTSRQQIVRLDRGHRAPLPPAAVRTLTRLVFRALRGARAAILSDYGYGVLGPAIRSAALRAAKRARAPVVVDSRSAPSGAPACSRRTSTRFRRRFTFLRWRQVLCAGRGRS
jgi:rfaE bifunctional protein kinase chain/domain